MAYTWDKMPSSRMGTNTTFTLTTNSQASAAFGAQTYQIRIGTSSGITQCFVKIGDGTPSATVTDGAMLGANVVDYFCVTPGQKVGVVSVAPAAGVVTVTEMQ